MVKEKINCQIIILFFSMFYPLRAKVYDFKISLELKKKRFATNFYSNYYGPIRIDELEIWKFLSKLYLVD
jgi:hypothetical protein